MKIVKFRPWLLVGRGRSIRNGELPRSARMLSLPGSCIGSRASRYSTGCGEGEVAPECGDGKKEAT